MNQESLDTPTSPLNWFAIRTPHDFAAEAYLRDRCEEVYFPKQLRTNDTGRTRIRPVIPHVLFIRTTAERLLSLEQLGREHPELSTPFWIYRFPKERRIQIIPQRSIDLLRLLTADDTSECRIYTGHTFRENQRVRIIDGLYKGYEGYVQRIRRNKHVLVKIEGICMVILPFIHPDLLEPIQ